MKKRKIQIQIKKEKEKNEDEFYGDENILIDQTNSNGKIVDCAFLFGQKSEKKLVVSI